MTGDFRLTPGLDLVRSWRQWKIECFLLWETMLHWRKFTNLEQGDHSQWEVVQVLFQSMSRLPMQNIGRLTCPEDSSEVNERWWRYNTSNQRKGGAIPGTVQAWVITTDSVIICTHNTMILIPGRPQSPAWHGKSLQTQQEISKISY